MGWRVGVAVLAAVVVAGCSATVPGTASPARDVPVAGLPFDDAERIFAEQMEIFRTWDVCAMHDVAAAERVSAAVAFAVRPARGYDGCEIAMEAAGTGDLAYVSIEVGVVDPGSAEPFELDGRSFPSAAAVPDSADRAERGYARPVASGWGVIVRGEVVDDTAGSCALAQAYLGEVAARLDDPPRRAAAGTAPAFALGEQDPCAALAALEPGPGDVTVPGPRLCALGALTVSFGLVQFEVDVDGVPGVVAGGRLETVDERPDACAVARQASDTTLLAPTLPYLYREALSVTAPDCDTARRHVEQILPTLPGPATAATGALALGSLDGHPVAADVGAPFDPCSTIGWAAFPAEVRPAGIDPRPFPSAVEAETRYRVGCDYSSDAIASIVSWGPPSGGYSIDPAVRPGAATQFAGRPGLEDRPPPGAGESPLCLSTMQIGTGLASIITLARESTADLCAVNRGVLEALSPLVP